jgi:hypothetical protein
MSEKINSDCLFRLEAKGEDISASVEGKARDIAELLANAAINSEEINMVLKFAMLMLAQHEMNQDEDEDEDRISEERFQAGKEAAVDLAQALFPLKMEEA